MRGGARRSRRWPRASTRAEAVVMVGPTMMLLAMLGGHALAEPAPEGMTPADPGDDGSARTIREGVPDAEAGGQVEPESVVSGGADPAEGTPAPAAEQSEPSEAEASEPGASDVSEPGASETSEPSASEASESGVSEASEPSASGTAPASASAPASGSGGAGTTSAPGSTPLQGRGRSARGGRDDDDDREQSRRDDDARDDHDDDDDDYDQGRRPGRDEGEWRAIAPFADLGIIRYRDPELRRTLWLSLDASGTYLPVSVGVADTPVWMARPAGAWALAVTPWLAVGGRHSIAWYDTRASRTRVHAHQLEVSSRPLHASRGLELDDRLAVGMSTHAIRWSESDGEVTTSGSGSLADAIVHAGYGMDHQLGLRWRLGWKAQFRFAWVASDTQRQARLSARLAFLPRPPHRVSLDAVGFYVNRDREPVGPSLPRNAIYGQFSLGYAWMSRVGLGPWTQLRGTTGFLSGEAPIYEIRDDALDAPYGELLLGMMARWS